MKTRLLLSLALSGWIVAGCQTPQPAPVPAPPVIAVPPLPPGERTQGVVIHLVYPASPQLRVLLSRVAQEVAPGAWAIQRVDLQNERQQEAVEAALRDGATITHNDR